MKHFTQHVGSLVNTFDLKNNSYPLIYAGDAPNITGGYNSSTSSLFLLHFPVLTLSFLRTCLENSLDEALVKGKIVLCDGFRGPRSVGLVSGAAGILLQSSYSKAVANIFALPAIRLSDNDGTLIYSYIKSTGNPIATIFKSNEGKDSSAPYIAPFSSRGPNAITSDILKPDIAAPGVNILAAWSPVSSISRVKGDSRIAKYNLLSGTSMACPHVTAAAVYIKSFHPNWSPAVIKSALMTTGNGHLATSMSAALNEEAEFAYGAGQINPIKAVNPGLVYDAAENDYVKFLCGQGYDTKKLRIITGNNSSCTATNNGTVWDLNLPSFAFSTTRLANISVVFNRNVTNVGSATSRYKATITTLPSSLKIQVVPDVLLFSSLGQIKSFTLKIEGRINADIVSSSLVWNDSTFQVRSPIVVYIYIVYMGSYPKGMEFSELLHTGMVQSVLGRKFSPDALLHSYKSFNGFVARLTEEEAETMRGMDGVVSVIPNRIHKLQTSRSWDFIGFPENVKRTSTESDIIVGIIDSGIWPNSSSFNDGGFGPPPQKWKGSCQNFTCNNKIVGAKYFRYRSNFAEEDIISPLDTDGHGTHCASIAGGNAVKSASVFGFASGTARGGVPLARIAVYKVCWTYGCNDADILAAFDAAIEDGVDILSISVGPSLVIHDEYFRDIIAIGAFHAMANGILTSKSADNLGPDPYSMSNTAPWLLSVAATTIDRKFFTNVQLGNGMIFQPTSVVDMIVPNQDSLDAALVKGKIVLCDADDYPYPTTVGFVSGASGVIIRSNIPLVQADIYALPAVRISQNDGTLVYSYLKSTSNPTATIFKSYEGKDSLAPCVAPFSSRGPNKITPDLLKPDLAAPGVDILAAWSPNSPISGVEGDNRISNYNILSGTSMACPHVTAAAAYVKSFHPNWSPAVIKSALMTTATSMSCALNEDAEFAYGAGQINPIQAINPGLVYDAGEIDYVKFLCGQGYDTQYLQRITGDSSSCTQANNGTVWDLNLPSFALSTTRSSYTNVTFSRTVTNVGSVTSSYKATITTQSSSLNIQVVPNVLFFSSLGQKKSFTLKIEGTINADIVSSSLVWDDGTFQVRSPIVVYVPA
ncbi:hypothetical protein CR513_04422, partial [Mucuna pruriens]